MMKRILVFILIFVLLFSFCNTAFAFTYINYATNSFNIEASGKANCDASLSAYPGVDSVRIYGYLKQLTNSGWVTIGSWSVNTQGTYTALLREKYVSSGYSYKYVVYYYAYSGDDVETTTKVVYDSY